MTSKGTPICYNHHPQLYHLAFEVLLAEYHVVISRTHTSHRRHRHQHNLAIKVYVYVHRMMRIFTYIATRAPYLGTHS